MFVLFRGDACSIVSQVSQQNVFSSQPVYVLLFTVTHWQNNYSGNRRIYVQSETRSENHWMYIFFNIVKAYNLNLIISEHIPDMWFHC